MAIDVENYEQAPHGLKLEQIHLFVRHGERTPVGVRLNNAPASIPEFWNLCKTARQFKAAVWSPDVGNAASLEIKRVVERRGGKSIEGECMPGELTDLGRQSTYNFGHALRKLYVEKLSLLPDTVKDEQTVYFRSTNMPRTIESLQQVISGLYPSGKFMDGVIPRVLIRHPKDENLLGNPFACPRLKELAVQFENATLGSLNKSLEPLDEKLSKYIGGKPIRIDGHPRASGILDTVRAAQAHGIKVPPEFEDPAISNTLESAVCSEWFDSYRLLEFRRLAMGRLFHELAGRMVKKAENGAKDPLKATIHSCHDSSLAGMCNTLDVFDGRWPEFTASITFELFSQRQDPHPEAGGSFLQSLVHKPRVEHYVRMRYQNRNLPLPACAPEGKHLEGRPEFCTLSAFKERVRQLTPTDWEKECSPTIPPMGHK